MNPGITISVSAISRIHADHWPKAKMVIDSIIREKRLKKYILAIDGDAYHNDIILFSKMYKEKISANSGKNKKSDA